MSSQKYLYVFTTQFELSFGITHNLDTILQQ